MRAFVAFAVRRRVAVMMTAIAFAAFGVVGYQRLSLDLLPDISYPSLTVQTDFPDSAPTEVENLVTRPVEEAVGVLRGLQTIHSVSRAGLSEVTLEFEWGSDMDLLAMEVREKLDRLILPEEATDPIVLRYDPSLDPIIRLALSGPDELTVLRRLALVRTIASSSIAYTASLIVTRASADVIIFLLLIYAFTLLPTISESFFLAMLNPPCLKIILIRFIIRRTDDTLQAFLS